MFKIAIASNFTCDPLKGSLGLMLGKLRIAHDVEIAPFNQIFQELLSPASSFRTNARGSNVIVFRIEDLVEEFRPDEETLRKVETHLAELRGLLLQSAEFRVPVVVVICPASERVRGDEVTGKAVDAMETDFVRVLTGTHNLRVFRGTEVLAMYGLETFDAPGANDYGRMPYTQEFYAALGAFIARQVSAQVSEPRKVVVLDCDQTLWKGVCGEDGIDGIEFDAPRLALQRFMREQSEAGMLICLCSKNNEPDVWNVFERRSEMLISRDHVVASRINWNFKSQNLRELAEELNLALASFVFVDDDPAVCSEVRANCPDVLTLQLPTEVEQIPEFLKHVWAFDKLTTTTEDRQRTESYRQQVQRSQLEKHSASIEDFLANLEIVCTIAEAEEHQVPRISQLSLRTNQFNATTIRRSEPEIRDLMKRDGTKLLTVNVSDRFGDYGLVGLIISDLLPNRLEVDSFMLSCRALGRGIEHRMVSTLGKAALDSGREFVDIRLVHSLKNAPVSQFLEHIAQTPGEQKDGQIVYRFSAEYASKLEFKPIQAASPAGLQTEENVPTPALLTELESQNAALVEIATTLTNATAILNAVRGRERARTASVEFRAPENETQKKLADIWRRNLNLSEIGIRDDFFELGGDSLLAVSLFVDVETAFGRHLPLTTLVSSPTIETMAAELDGTADAPSFKYLVPLKTGGSGTPLFCMHAAGGNVLFYRDLAAELDDDQPVYGLQARGVADKSETAHESVQEMASEYLKEIRSVQPIGPYKLCGSSFGGLIAFEIALQLRAVGEQVALVALFDTYAPGYPKFKKNGSALSGAFRKLNERLAVTRAQLAMIESTRGKAEFITGRIKKMRMRARRQRVWKQNQFDIAYAEATGRELPDNIQRNHQAIQTALNTYVPQVYPDRITIYRATLQPRNAIFDEHLGWGKFATGQISVTEVPGAHGALTVYPFVTKLAEKLKGELKKCDRPREFESPSVKANRSRTAATLG